MVQMTTRMNILEHRAVDPEGRSCRNNLHFLRSPEHAEGTVMEQFMEEWVQ